MTHSGDVLGVDGCRAGWVGIVLALDGGVRGVFGATMAELAAAAGPVDAVGIDMPLHVTDEAGPRASDLAARSPPGAQAVEPVHHAATPRTWRPPTPRRARCPAG